MEKLTEEQSKLVATHLHVAETVVADFSSHFRKHPEKGQVGHDDIQSEAYIALCGAALAYDPQRASFSTWARHKVRSCLLDMLRRASGGRKGDPLERFDTKGLMYDETNTHGRTNDQKYTRDPTRKFVHLTPESTEPHIDDEVFVDSLLNLCTEIERQVVELTEIQGMTHDEAAEKMGLCPQRINTARSTALKRMKHGKKYNPKKLTVVGLRHSDDISIGAIQPTTDTSGSTGGASVPDLPGPSEVLREVPEDPQQTGD